MPEGYKTITVSEELFERMNKIRERLEKELHVPSLSWNDFLSIVEGKIKEDRAKESKNA